MFGQRIDGMSLADAIREKWITDYEIILPVIGNKNEEFNKYMEKVVGKEKKSST